MGDLRHAPPSPAYMHFESIVNGDDEAALLLPGQFRLRCLLPGPCHRRGQPATVAPDARAVARHLRTWHREQYELHVPQTTRASLERAAAMQADRMFFNRPRYYEAERRRVMEAAALRMWALPPDADGGDDDNDDAEAEDLDEEADDMPQGGAAAPPPQPPADGQEIGAELGDGAADDADELTQLSTHTATSLSPTQSTSSAPSTTAMIAFLGVTVVALLLVGAVRRTDAATTHVVMGSDRSQRSCTVKLTPLRCLPTAMENEHEMLGGDDVDEALLPTKQEEHDILDDPASHNGGGAASAADGEDDLLGVEPGGDEAHLLADTDNGGDEPPGAGVDKTDNDLFDAAAVLTERMPPPGAHVNPNVYPGVGGGGQQQQAHQHQQQQQHAPPTMPPPQGGQQQQQYAGHHQHQ